MRSIDKKPIPGDKGPERKFSLKQKLTAAALVGLASLPVGLLANKQLNSQQTLQQQERTELAAKQDAEYKEKS